MLCVKWTDGGGRRAGGCCSNSRVFGLGRQRSSAGNGNTILEKVCTKCLVDVLKTFRTSTRHFVQTFSRIVFPFPADDLCRPSPKTLELLQQPPARRPPPSVHFTQSIHRRTMNEELWQKFDKLRGTSTGFEGLAEFFKQEELSESLKPG